MRLYPYYIALLRCPAMDFVITPIADNSVERRVLDCPNGVHAVAVVRSTCVGDHSSDESVDVAERDRQNRLLRAGAGHRRSGGLSMSKNDEVGYV